MESYNVHVSFCEFLGNKCPHCDLTTRHCHELPCVGQDDDERRGMTIQASLSEGKVVHSIRVTQKSLCSPCQFCGDDLMCFHTIFNASKGSLDLSNPCTIRYVSPEGNKFVDEFYVTKKTIPFVARMLLLNRARQEVEDLGCDMSVFKDSPILAEFWQQSGYIKDWAKHLVYGSAVAGAKLVSPDNAEEISAMDSTVKWLSCTKELIYSWFMTIRKYVNKAYGFAKDTATSLVTTFSVFFNCIKEQFSKCMNQFVAFVSGLVDYFWQEDTFLHRHLTALKNFAFDQAGRAKRLLLGEKSNVEPQEIEEDRSSTTSVNKDILYFMHGQAGEDDSWIAHMYAVFMGTFGKICTNFSGIASGFGSRLVKLCNGIISVDRVMEMASVKRIINYTAYLLGYKSYYPELRLIDDFNACVRRLASTFDDIEKVRNPPMETVVKLADDYRELIAIYNSLLVYIKSSDVSRYSNIVNHWDKKTSSWIAAYNSERIKPIVVILRGKSCTGKTTTLNRLTRDITEFVRDEVKRASEIVGKDVLAYFEAHARMPGRMTVQCSGDIENKYDDGYLNQMYYHFNELFTSKVNDVNLHWFNKFFTAISEEPYMLNMAFGDKGKRYFQSPFVFASGNFDTINVPLGDANAFYRRVELYLDCEVDNDGTPYFKMMPENKRIIESKMCPSPVLKEYAKQETLSYEDLVYICSAAYVERLCSFSLAHKQFVREEIIETLQARKEIREVIFWKSVADCREKLIAARKLDVLDKIDCKAITDYITSLWHRSGPNLDGKKRHKTPPTAEERFAHKYLDNLLSDMSGPESNEISLPSDVHISSAEDSTSGSLKMVPQGGKDEKQARAVILRVVREPIMGPQDPNKVLLWQNKVIEDLKRMISMRREAIELDLGRAYSFVNDLTKPTLCIALDNSPWKYQLRDQESRMQWQVALDNALHDAKWKYWRGDACTLTDRSALTRSQWQELKVIWWNIFSIAIGCKRYINEAYQVCRQPSLHAYRVEIELAFPVMNTKQLKSVRSQCHKLGGMTVNARGALAPIGAIFPEKRVAYKERLAANKARGGGAGKLAEEVKARSVQRYKAPKTRDVGYSKVSDRKKDKMRTQQRARVKNVKFVEQAGGLKSRIRVAFNSGSIEQFSEYSQYLVEPVSSWLDWSSPAQRYVIANLDGEGHAMLTYSAEGVTFCKLHTIAAVLSQRYNCHFSSRAIDILHGLAEDKNLSPRQIWDGFSRLMLPEPMVPFLTWVVSFYTDSPTDLLSMFVDGDDDARIPPRALPILQTLCELMHLRIDVDDLMEAEGSERSDGNWVDTAYIMAKWAVIVVAVGSVLSGAYFLIKNLLKRYSTKEPTLDDTIVDAVAELQETLSANGLKMTIQGADYPEPKAKKQDVRAKVALEQKGVRYSVQSGIEDPIISKIARNRYAIYTLGGTLIGSITYLFGQIALMNYHVFEQLPENFEVVSGHPEITKTPARFTLRKEKCEFLKGNKEDDYAIVFIPCFVQHARIDKFFSSGILPHEKVPGFVLSWDKMKAAPIIDAITLDWAESADLKTAAGKPMRNCFYYKWPNAVSGACGSILMSKYGTGTWQIVGMHRFGDSNRNWGGAVALCKTICEGVDFESMARRPLAKVQPYVALPLETEDNLFGTYSMVEQVGYKTPVITSATDRTVYCSTPFEQYAFKGGCSKRPAVLTNEAYQKGLAKEQALETVLFPDSSVSSIVEAYSSEIAEVFLGGSTKIISPTRTLTVEESLFGYDELGAFDASTSKGMRLRKLGLSKRKILAKEEPDFSKFKEVVNDLDELRSKGDYQYQLNFDKLKDELRDHARVDACKTRIFKITDFVDNVQIKRAIGGLVNQLKHRNVYEPPACGINPYGLGWSELARKFEDCNVVWTDISGFESTVTSLFFPIMWSLINNAYLDTDSRCFAMWAIMSCVHGLRFDRGSGFHLGRQNTSGNWITTFLNTFVNCCYFSVVVIYLALQNGDDPIVCLTDLRLKIYSDDNLSALPGRSWYTPTNIAQAFAKLFHIKLTGTSKDEVTNEDCSGTIDQADFLSRGFRKERGIYFCPLKTDSLYSRLYYVKVPKSLRESRDYIALQTQINIDGFCDELMEYSVDDGDRMAAELQEFITHHNLPYRISYLYGVDRVEHKLNRF